MMTAALHPDFSLAALETQINAFAALWGVLTTIDNDGTDTIAVYDDTRLGVAIRLRLGAATPTPGESLVSTGQVFVLSALQQVTAYA